MKRVAFQLAYVLVFGLAGYWAIIPATFPSFIAQGNCCSPPHSASAAARFPQGAIVTVYIDSSPSGFTGEEQQLIKSGIEDWNDEPNNSRVTYNVQITSAPPPAGTNNTILVQFNDEFSTGTGGALLNMHSSSGPGGTSIYGEMLFFNNIRKPERVESKPEQIRATARHEVAHGIGLANATDCPEGSTIMNPSWTQETFITPCDNDAINTDPNYPTPTPTPSPSPSPTPSCPDWCPNLYAYPPAQCFGPTDECAFPDDGCDGDLQPNGRCCCIANTPILVDLLGNGFSLTNFETGVDFDLRAIGFASQTSWTEINSDDAFLALDRNGNGVIDDGSELFGNATPQLPSAAGVARNGFLALAEYDKAANGGNTDGMIDGRDAVYGALRLWRDLNHNGVSEQQELSPLMHWHVDGISLDFKESRRRDEWGNGFRYRSRVAGGKVGRWAYDVVLENRPRH